MKAHDEPRHPGPWRVMRVNPEFAGVLIAVGFLVMGLVSMPIATGFVLGAITLGVIVALLLRFTPQKFSRVALGSVLILAAVALWWIGHRPRRPRTVASNALYVLPNNVPFTLHRRGYWLDCRFDEYATVDRCRLTNEDGTLSFDDVFLPCVGKEPLHPDLLVFNAQRTGETWTRSPGEGVNVPAVVLADGQVLLPQSFYDQAKRDEGCAP